MSGQEQQQETKTVEQESENKQWEIYLVPLLHY